MVILYNSEQEVTWHSGLGISAQKKSCALKGISNGHTFMQCHTGSGISAAHHSIYLDLSAQNAQALTPHLQHGVFLCPFSCHFIVPAKVVFYYKEMMMTNEQYRKTIPERVEGLKVLQPYSSFV